jgi:hypothetical protein
MRQCRLFLLCFGITGAQACAAQDWLVTPTDALMYKPASVTLRIHNTFPSTMHIEALEFTLTEIQSTRQPRVVFDISPFLDVLVLHLANIGEGTWPGGTLELFQADAIPGRFDRQTLAELFDTSDVALTIPPVRDEYLDVIRMGPQARVFSWATAGPVDANALRLPASGTGLRTVQVPLTVAAFVPEQTNSGHGYAATVQFHGRLQTPDGTPNDISYFARTLQRIPMSTDERRFFEAFEPWSVPTAGLRRQWICAFGDIKARVVHEAKVQAFSRLDVPLGSVTGQPIRVSQPVRLEVPQGMEVSFLVEMHPQQSCRFKVHADCVFRFKGANTARRPLKVQPEHAQAFVPRASSLATEEGSASTVLKALIARDPGIVTRAREVLEHTTYRRDPRRVLDAMHIGLEIGDDAMRKAALDRLGAALREQPDNSPEELFLIACHIAPDRAVQWAVEAQNRFTRETLLTKCLCIDTTRVHMKGTGQDILRVVDATQTDLSPAARMMLGSTRDRQQVLEDLQSGRVDRPTIPMVVCACAGTRDQEIRSAIRAYLTGLPDARRRASSAQGAMISELRKWADFGYMDEVLEILDTTLRERSRSDLVRECVEYVSMAPRDPRVIQILDRARVYPEDAGVRRRAEAVLGLREE